jgi:hypothetical protein
MLHTFLVELSDDETDFFAQAADLEDHIAEGGFNVTSVKPWAQHNAVAPLSGPAPATPPVAPAN